MIEVEQLTHAYGAKVVLRGISFKVAPGEVVGFLGPNGAGKSTTLKLLLGILAPSGGTVRVGGHVPSAAGLAVKAMTGYVPESGALYETFTPREYLTMVGRLRGLTDRQVRDRATEALGAFDLGDKLDTRMTGFSKGMKQKVVFVAAILHDPRLLLLDEPLNGLDASSTIVVKDVVRGLAARGTTVLYSSHLMDVVERVSERVLILDGGRLVADGRLDELKARAGDGTLEALFHRLTAGDIGADRAAHVLRALHGRDAGAPVAPPPPAEPDATGRDAEPAGERDR